MSQHYFISVSTYISTQSSYTFFAGLFLTKLLVRVARFNNTESLSLYFDKNFGADETKICYIGLRGDFSEVNTD